MSSQQQWTETLQGGERVLIRPICAGDVASNAKFIEALSPPSKHFLFLGGIAHLSEDALRRLCDPDYAHDMAYVALALEADSDTPTRQVGVCRYAGADAARGAEISVAVADEWQRKGLGGLLLRHLIDYARSHGVKRLYSIDAASNERMRRLARHLEFAQHADPDDPTQIIYSREL